MPFEGSENLDIDTSEIAEDAGTESVDALENEIEDSEEQELSFEEWEKQQNEAEKSKDSQSTKSEDSKDEKETNDKDEQDKDEDKESKEDKDEDKEQSGPQKFTIKVDGEEKEVEFDPSNKEEVSRLLSKAEGADRRFQEAHNIREEAREFITQLKETPVEAFKRLGIDFEEIAENHVYEKIRVSQMNEDQKRAHEQERIAKEREQELNRYKQQEQKQEEERRVAEQRQQISNMMRSTIERFNLPKSEFVTGRLAVHLRNEWRNGNRYATTDDIAHKVQAEIEQIREQSRKESVEKYKQEQKIEPQRKAKATGYKPRAKAKRFSSIYDLMD